MVCCCLPERGSTCDPTQCLLALTTPNNPSCLPIPVLAVLSRLWHHKPSSPSPPPCHSCILAYTPLEHRSHLAYYYASEITLSPCSPCFLSAPHCPSPGLLSLAPLQEPPSGPPALVSLPSIHSPHHSLMFRLETQVQHLGLLFSESSAFPLASRLNFKYLSVSTPAPTRPPHLPTQHFMPLIGSEIYLFPSCQRSFLLSSLV